MSNRSCRTSLKSTTDESVEYSWFWSGLCLQIYQSNCLEPIQLELPLSDQLSSVFVIYLNYRIGVNISFNIIVVGLYPITGIWPDDRFPPRPELVKTDNQCRWAPEGWGLSDELPDHGKLWMYKMLKLLQIYHIIYHLFCILRIFVQKNLRKASMKFVEVSRSFPLEQQNFAKFLDSEREVKCPMQSYLWPLQKSIHNTDAQCAGPGTYDS